MCIRSSATTTRKRCRDLSDACRRSRLGAGLENLADFRTIAIAERTAVAELQPRIASAAVAFVPLLDHDVHDVDALTAVGRYLLTGASAGAVRR